MPPPLHSTHIGHATGLWIASRLAAVAGLHSAILGPVPGLTAEAGSGRRVEASKVDLGQLPVGAVDLEVLGLLQVHHRRHDRGRELLRLRVEVAHVRVVETAACGDAILGVGQLLLEVEEARVGAQRRVVFGNSKKPRKRARQG